MLGLTSAQSTTLLAALKKQPVGVTVPTVSPVAAAPNVSLSLRSGYLVGGGSVAPATPTAALPTSRPTIGSVPSPVAPVAPAPAGSINTTVKSMLAFAGVPLASTASTPAAKLADNTLRLAARNFGVGPYAGAYAQAVKDANAAGAKQFAADTRAQIQAGADANTRATQDGLMQDHPLGGMDPMTPSYALTPTADTSIPAASVSDGSSSLGTGALLALGALVLLLFARKH